MRAPYDQNEYIRLLRDIFLRDSTQDGVLATCFDASARVPSLPFGRLGGTFLR